MSTYSLAVKTNRMLAVRDALDANASPGYLELGTTGMALLLGTITLDAVSGTVSGDTLTLSGFPKSDTAADNTGIAAEAVFKDGSGAIVQSGLTVGLAGSSPDIVLDSVNITAGQTITLNSATITHGA